MKMEIQIKIKTQEGFCGLINWCRKEGSERNSEREKKERERDHRVRERETQASGQEVRKTRPKSRTALVANRNQFFVGPPLMTLMAPVRPSPFAHGSKQIRTKRLDDTHPLLRECECAMSP
jgi:hypothetical protein